MRRQPIAMLAPSSCASISCATRARSGRSFTWSRRPSVGASGIVSFNGRGFDMPLVHNRFVLASMPPPLVGAPAPRPAAPGPPALEDALGFLQPGQPGAQRARPGAYDRGRPRLSHPGYLSPVLPDRRDNRDARPGLLPQPARRRVDGAAGRAHGSPFSTGMRWMARTTASTRWSA